MTQKPFAGLEPAMNAEHVSWLLRSLVPPPVGGVSFRVPPGFEAIVRVHHQLHAHCAWITVDPDADLRQAPALPYPLPDQLEAVAGDLDDDTIDDLLPTLRRSTDSPDRIHFAQWQGWGDLHRGSSTTTMPIASNADREANDQLNERLEADAEPVYAFVERCPSVEWWGGRTMFLFDGPIDGVAAIGNGSRFYPTELRRRCPQWWWPKDQSWFVATEIDDPCSYIAGSDELISQIEQLSLDTVRVRRTDSW